MNLEEFIAFLPGGARPSGRGKIARCPAHDDKNPSLSISEGDDGRVLLKCQAGCTFESILAKLGLNPSDLFPSKNGNSNGKGLGKEIAAYDYRDENGALLFQVVRYQPKAFRQRRPDGKGGWVNDLNEVRRVLYRLPDVVAANFVAVCEGEKDCEMARKIDLVATCNPMGAGKWRPEYSEFLRGKIVCVIADADEPGRRHAQDVASSLYGKAKSLVVVELPGAKDLTEWVERGGTRERLELIRDVPGWVPATAPKAPLIKIYTAEELTNAVSEEIEFLAKPCAARGILTAVDGDPKGSGKTTFVLRGVYAMLNNALFLNERTQRAPVMLVTEENPRTLKEALRRAELEDERDLHIIPWSSLATVPWSALTEFLDAKCRELKIGLLVIDTLYAVSKLRPEEENQAAAVDALIAPLRSMAADQNMAVIVTRHDRKSGGPVGQSGRGTSALTGAVDVVLQLKRPEGNQASTMRQLDILSRLDLPDRMMIELRGTQYISWGERADIKTAGAEETIMKYVPTSKDAAMTKSEILDLAKLADSKPVKTAFEKLVKNGDLRTTQKYFKGRPRTAYFTDRPFSDEKKSS